MKKITFLLLFVSFSLFGIEEKFFTSSHQFKEISDFVLHLNPKHNVHLNFDPEEVFEKAIVYVHVHHLPLFFSNYHPKIPHRYLLITHGGDPSAPADFTSFLEDEKLIAWFGRNPTLQRHDKFFPIPIGMKIRVAKGEEVIPPIIRKVQNLELDKEHLLYLNISIRTCPEERQLVYDLLFDKPYAYSCERKTFEEYLKDLKRSKFTVSPKGHGLDCFRTWEALLMGCIPIVKSSPLDPLFEDLPVVIVQEWNEITEEFLSKKYEEISQKTYSLDELYISYWKEKIYNFLNRT